MGSEGWCRGVVFGGVGVGGVEVGGVVVGEVVVGGLRPRGRSPPPPPPRAFELFKPWTPRVWSRRVGVGGFVV